MPPAAIDHDKTSVDATTTNGTTKTKMTRNSVDHIKSFEVAVFQYKEDPSEKNLASVEKVLQASLYPQPDLPKRPKGPNSGVIRQQQFEWLIKNIGSRPGADLIKNFWSRVATLL
jgi:hypothetical protein